MLMQSVSTPNNSVVRLPDGRVGRLEKSHLTGRVRVFFPGDKPPVELSNSELVDFLIDPATIIDSYIARTFPFENPSELWTVLVDGDPHFSFHAISLKQAREKILAWIHYHGFLDTENITFRPAKGSELTSDLIHDDYVS